MSNTKNIKRRALVLGIDDRAALAVVRSLGRRGIEVHQGSDFSESICGFSRYTTKVIPFPSAGSDEEAWVERLEEVLRTESYDLIIPTADNYLVPAVRYRERLQELGCFAIPDDRGFEYTYKKDKTMELAAQLQVPLPLSQEFSRLEDIDYILKTFELPVVIKPVSSKVWQADTRHNMNVALALDRQDLETRLRKLLAICPVLIQSFHAGVGVGQEFLMKDGEMIAAFQHQRVHEPFRGGGSSYRKSVALDPQLLEHSLAMLRELRWTGVAMVEYKQNLQTGKSVLMEINGRFWGSLPLALNAGVDFPALLFDMLVEGKLPGNYQPGKGIPYKKNVYCRNFVKDFDWFKENLWADKSDPYSMTVPLHKALAEVRNWLLLREHFDTLPLDDLKPGIIHIGRYIRGNYLGAKAKFHKMFLRLNYGSNPLTIWWRGRRIKKLLRDNPAVNFICKGNICRSPFAEFYLKKRFTDANMTHIQVTSVGILQKENRLSPEYAVESAQGFGVDITPHRSKIMTGEDVQRYGVLFVMDTELYERVLEQFPEARKKLFFLGEMNSGFPRSIEIIDPYGSKVETFNRIYKQIVRTVDPLFSLMRAAGAGK